MLLHKSIFMLFSSCCFAAPFFVTSKIIISVFVEFLLSWRYHHLLGHYFSRVFTGSACYVGAEDIKTIRFYYYIFSRLLLNYKIIQSTIVLGIIAYSSTTTTSNIA